MQMADVCVGDLAVIIPADGASSRMLGADKLMQDVDGRPCISHIVRRALQVSDTVVVCVPDTEHPRAAALDGMEITLVSVPDAAKGMSQSLKEGIKALPDSISAAMILPADMPDITGSDMAQLWAVFQASGLGILQAASKKGDAGHPVIFARNLFPAFETLIGDKGAQAIIQANRKSHALLPIAGTHATLDLDTPEDWAAWRASR